MRAEWVLAFKYRVDDILLEESLKSLYLYYMPLYNSVRPNIKFENETVSKREVVERRDGEISFERSGTIVG